MLAITRLAGAADRAGRLPIAQLSAPERVGGPATEALPVLLGEMRWAVDTEAQQHLGHAALASLHRLQAPVAGVLDRRLLAGKYRQLAATHKALRVYCGSITDANTHNLCESQMFKITLLILSLASTTVLANSDMTSSPNRQSFNDTLQKELTNRATARQAIEAIAAQSLEPDARLFWESYARLEVLNLQWYTPVATELRLEPSAFSAWLKGRSAALYYRITPEHMLKTMAKATISYYQALEYTTAKVAADYRPFYQYVLDQERAQVKAFTLAAAGDYRNASVHLDAFVTTHQPAP
ncbi:hypothetical protein ACIPZ8_14965 [Pseudomonas sp. NPDC089422]|uniref:hypothetical protein n=1 Tax=Pseudomonas sp. NPDC089422 TaxID=3364466 RepID=UPI0037F9A579